MKTPKIKLHCRYEAKPKKAIPTVEECSNCKSLKILNENCIICGK